MRVRDQRDGEIKEYSGVDLRINDKLASADALEMKVERLADGSWICAVRDVVSRSAQAGQEAGSCWIRVTNGHLMRAWSALVSALTIKPASERAATDPIPRFKCNAIPHF
jgi:hypothetical protein